MSAGYFRPKTITLAVSGSASYDFDVESAPWVSLQAHKDGGGKLDANYVVWVSNYSALEVPGYGQFLSGTVVGSAPVSGTQYQHYWAPAYDNNGVALTGTLFTGSVASDPPASVMVNLTNVNAKHIRLVASSGWGGSLTLFPHIKTGG